MENEGLHEPITSSRQFYNYFDRNDIKNYESCNRPSALLSRSVAPLDFKPQLISKEDGPSIPFNIINNNDQDIFANSRSLKFNHQNPLKQKENDNNYLWNEDSLMKIYQCDTNRPLTFGELAKNNREGSNDKSATKNLFGLPSKTDKVFSLVKQQTKKYSSAKADTNKADNSKAGYKTGNNTDKKNLTQEKKVKEEDLSDDDKGD